MVWKAEWKVGEDERKMISATFFLIFNLYYALVAVRTEAVMMRYASVENRGRNITLFASAAYASCLKPRPNDQNNSDNKSFLH